MRVRVRVWVWVWVWVRVGVGVRVAGSHHLHEVADLIVHVADLIALQGAACRVRVQGADLIALQVDAPRGREVVAQLHPHLARQLALTHEVIERVHRRLVGDTLRVVSRRERCDGADREGPHGARQHHEDYADAALQRAHGPVIREADRCERRNRPG